jgi:hypothetical protein
MGNFPETARTSAGDWALSRKLPHAASSKVDRGARKGSRVNLRLFWLRSSVPRPAQGRYGKGVGLDHRDLVYLLVHLSAVITAEARLKSPLFKKAQSSMDLIDLNARSSAFEGGSRDAIDNNLGKSGSAALALTPR